MRIAILLPLTLLAGCGGGSTTSNSVVATAPSEPSAFQNQVDALPEAQRNGVMIRAIRDAGRDCQGVTKSERRGETEGQPLYIATCQGGATFGVLIGRDGTAQVVGAP